MLCCLLLPEEAFTIVVVAGVLDKADLCGPRVLLVLECVFVTVTETVILYGIKNRIRRSGRAPE